MASKSGLTIAINGDAKGLSRTLRKVRRDLTGFAKSAAGMIAGYFAFSKVASFFSGMIQGFGKIEEASQRLGVGIERIQQLEYAAKQTGFGIDAVRGALQKLQKTAGEALGGSKSASTFAQLGLTLDELKGLSPDQLLDKVAVALRDIDDPLERAALQTQLFGKSGLELNEFLKDYIRLGNDAKAQGLIVDEKAVKAAADFGDAITAIGRGFTAWVASIPAVQSLLDLLGGFKEMADAKANKATSGTKTRGEALGLAMDNISSREDLSLWQKTKLTTAFGDLIQKGKTRDEESVRMLNEELDRMGYGVFKLERKKGGVMDLGRDYYAAANPSVEQSTKRLTPAEQAAEAERIKAAKAAAEAEKQKRAQQRAAAKAAAAQAEADKKAKERQKLIDKVVGGSEASTMQMRLNAQSPALAEYMGALSQITAAGQTLTAAEDERLRRSIAERMAMQEPGDKVAAEAAVPRFIEAATRGSLEEYKIRTAAGGDIPSKQLKVAEKQAKNVAEIAEEIKEMAAKQTGSGIALASIGG